MILCTNNVRRSGPETHLTDNCPKQIINCSEGGTRELITCPDLPIQCHITGCRQQISRHKLRSRASVCEYRALGCKAFIRQEEQESVIIPVLCQTGLENKACPLV